MRVVLQWAVGPGADAVRAQQEDDPAQEARRCSPESYKRVEHYANGGMRVGQPHPATGFECTSKVVTRPRSVAEPLMTVPQQ